MNDMEKKPLVSIIVSAYNEKRDLPKMIMSVLNQNYKNFELIIVDSHSKDNTYELAKEFEKKDKRIIVLKQKEGVTGPGNAWNLAVKNSKGKILFFEGADTMLGKEYIKDMIRPILEGKRIGTMHVEEKVANKNNILARSFGARRCVDENNEGVIFGAILREYYDKAGGFEPKLGYADDKTLYNNLKIKSLGVDAEIYHHNPDNMPAIWRHHKWVGASLKHPYLMIIMAPLIPLLALYKTIRQLREEFTFSLLLFLPFYNTIRYAGYFVGALRKIVYKRIY